MSSYWSKYRKIRSEMNQLDADYDEMQFENLPDSHSDHTGVEVCTHSDNDSFHEEPVCMSDNTIENDVIDESDNDVNIGESDDNLMLDDLVAADLAVDLASWSAQHRLTRAATNDLLSILIKHGHDVPKDQRTLQKVPSKITTVSKIDGTYIYFGIANGLADIFSEKSAEIPNPVLLDFNVDGLPLFKSSGLTFWPTLCMALSKVFPVFLWCGNKSKPTSVDEYLEEFVNELKLLQQQGIMYEGVKIDVEVKYFICDAPARAFLKGIIGHNGHHSCERCTVKGVSINYRMVMKELDEALRTDEEFANLSYQGTHQTSKSSLIDLGVKCVFGFPLDYMHLVCLGVTRRTLNFFKSGPRVCKLSQQQFSEISDHLKSLRGYLPNEFVRQPRSLEDLNRWKATELRSFLLYTGPIVLKPVLRKESYHHFLCLSIAVSILLDSNDHERVRLKDYANALLRYYVAEAAEFYSEIFIVYNVHNLIHLSDNVDEVKSLNDLSAFPYENYLQKLKKIVRNGNNPVVQVAKRLQQLKRFGHKRQNSKKFSKISVNKPNNTFFLGKQNVVILTNQREDGVFDANKYCLDNLKPLFKEPEDSRKFQIACLDNNTRAKRIQVHQSEFTRKAVRLPYNNGFAIFPLCHEIEK